MQLGAKPLIDIGSCNLHLLHNGFHDASVTSVDQSWGIEELMSDVFSFFKKYPSRSEDRQDAGITEYGEESIQMLCQ